MARAPVVTVDLDRLRAALAPEYQIERELGRGGMATVYLARERKHDRMVAIKVLRPEIASLLGPERFFREIRIAARLCHPHIVPLLASDVAAGSLYYVMPYVEGESLRAHLDRERQMSLEAAVRIAWQVASALSYSHANGIVHRDIKPENILLSGGVAMVADFGIAMAVAQAGSSRLTEPGLIVGTPSYMSPEQVGGPIDGRSDLYSLGCVVYEMLTGEPPFNGPTPAATRFRHALDPMPSIRTVRPGIPEAVERALSRVLAKVPADRFATADEFAAALEARDAVLPPPEAPEGSIAVLPFVDSSKNHDQAYLCEGIAEELIDALTRLGTIRVASRTSAFALSGKGLDVCEIGRRLHVRSVLEGVVRAAGERFRVSVSLTSVEDGYQSWSVRYDCAMADVFEIQDEIARTVVSRLGLGIDWTGGPVVAPGTSDPEAYRVYLRGRHFANRRTESDLRQAIASFESALGQESGFHLAAAGLGDAWFMLGLCGAVAPDEAMPQARHAIERAVASGREIAEVLSVLGSVRAVYEWDWAGAEADFRRALALAPANPAVLHRYALDCLVPRGRLDQADTVLRQALERDPLSLVTTTALGWLNVLQGRTAQAATAFRSALELDPSFGLAKYFLGLALLHGGSPVEAVAALEEATAVTGPSMETLAALGSACAVAGRREDAERILAELESTARTRYVSPVLLAQLLLSLGRPEDALCRLEEGSERHAAEMIWLAVRPTWGSLRGHPRFQALLRQVRLE
jgi:serine/threonine protein kinase/Tfp pilus assembly protein PilF